VLLLTRLLFGHLRRFKAISASYYMIASVFVDLVSFLVVFGTITTSFALVFRFLLPQTAPFYDFPNALQTVFYTALLGPDLEQFPTTAAKVCLVGYTVLSLIVLLNMIISILSDTYDRIREVQAAVTTRQRLQLTLEMQQSNRTLCDVWRWLLGRVKAHLERRRNQQADRVLRGGGRRGGRGGLWAMGSRRNLLWWS
jgi:hypothetical protein